MLPPLTYALTSLSGAHFVRKSETTCDSMGSAAELYMMAMRRMTSRFMVN